MPFISSGCPAGVMAYHSGFCTFVRVFGIFSTRRHFIFEIKRETGLLFDVSCVVNVGRRLSLWYGRVQYPAQRIQRGDPSKHGADSLYRFSHAAKKEETVDFVYCCGTVRGMDSVWNGCMFASGGRNVDCRSLSASHY